MSSLKGRTYVYFTHGTAVAPCRNHGPLGRRFTFNDLPNFQRANQIRDSLEERLTPATFHQLDCAYSCMLSHSGRLGSYLWRPLGSPFQYLQHVGRCPSVGVRVNRTKGGWCAIRDRDHLEPHSIVFEGHETLIFSDADEEAAHTLAYL